MRHQIAFGAVLDGNLQLSSTQFWRHPIAAAEGLVDQFRGTRANPYLLTVNELDTHEPVAFGQ